VRIVWTLLRIHRATERAQKCSSQGSKCGAGKKAHGSRLSRRTGTCKPRAIPYMDRGFTQDLVAIGRSYR